MAVDVLVPRGVYRYDLVEDVAEDRVVAQHRKDAAEEAPFSAPRSHATRTCRIDSHMLMNLVIGRIGTCQGRHGYGRLLLLWTEVVVVVVVVVVIQPGKSRLVPPRPVNEECGCG
jgi:hypothetical protein